MSSYSYSFESSGHSSSVSSNDEDDTVKTKCKPALAQAQAQAQVHSPSTSPLKPSHQLYNHHHHHHHNHNNETTNSSCSDYSLNSSCYTSSTTATNSTCTSRTTRTSLNAMQESSPVKENGATTKDDDDDDEGATKKVKCLWNKCKFVGRPVDVDDSFLDHIRAKHINVQKTTYRCMWRGCSVYNKMSRSFSWLESHFVYHVDTKPFSCIIAACKKKFVTEHALRRHVQSHMNSSGSGGMYGSACNAATSPYASPTKLSSQNLLKMSITDALSHHNIRKEACEAMSVNTSKNEATDTAALTNATSTTGTLLGNRQTSG